MSHIVTDVSSQNGPYRPELNAEVDTSPDEPTLGKAIHCRAIFVRHGSADTSRLSGVRLLLGACQAAGDVPRPDCDVGIQVGRAAIPEGADREHRVHVSGSDSRLHHLNGMTTLRLRAVKL